MTMVKTTMNLPQESIDILRDLATTTGVSMAEVVRRSVAIDKFLHDTKSEGGKILIKDKNNSFRELLIF